MVLVSGEAGGRWWEGVLKGWGYFQHGEGKDEDIQAQEGGREGRAGFHCILTPVPGLRALHCLVLCLLNRWCRSK